VAKTRKQAEEALVVCHLDELLKNADMTLTELSKRVEVSVVNLSLLKNGHAKAIRFTTLRAICHALECDVGDLLTIYRD
jgi:putative transcriptional regulator